MNERMFLWTSGFTPRPQSLEHYLAQEISFLKERIVELPATANPEEENLLLESWKSYHSALIDLYKGKFFPAKKLLDDQKEALISAICNFYRQGENSIARALWEELNLIWEINKLSVETRN